MTDFLNHLSLPKERQTSDVSTIWSLARKSLAHVSSSLEIDGADVFLSVEGEQFAPNQRQKLKRAHNNACEVTQGYTTVTTHAFIIGFLGSWDPDNAQALPSQEGLPQPTPRPPPRIPYSLILGEQATLAPAFLTYMY